MGYQHMAWRGNDVQHRLSLFVFGLGNTIVIVAVSGIHHTISRVVCGNTIMVVARDGIHHTIKSE